MTLSTEAYTYDNNGNVAMVSDRKSQVTTYTYDATEQKDQGDLSRQRLDQTIRTMRGSGDVCARKNCT